MDIICPLGFGIDIFANISRHSPDDRRYDGKLIRIWYFSKPRRSERHDRGPAVVEPGRWFQGDLAQARIE
jgi:hypothetical protein